MTLTVAETRQSAAPPHIGGKEIFYPESDGKPTGETDYHISLIAHLLETLRTHFQATTDVKILADIMFYYEEGVPQKVIAPDVMVVKGVGKHTRRVFKLWEERAPDVVFEISSRGTWADDLQKKFLLYQSFGVKEYYIFDPEYDYLPEPLVAYHLKDARFEKLKVKKGRVFSPSLALEIVDTGETLRLFDPARRELLPTMEELAKRATRAEKLESELEQLKAELTRLKKRK